MKPENIFLALRDEEETVKLLDFGALKDLGPSRLAQWTQPIGTLPYMSPEAVQGREIDCRADLWSLAVVLYRMIAGALPFEAQSISELVRKICHDAAPRPSCRAAATSPTSTPSSPARSTATSTIASSPPTSSRAPSPPPSASRGRPR